MTPLALASKNGHDEVVHVLLESKASLRIRNSDGLNPLVCQSTLYVPLSLDYFSD